MRRCVARATCCALIGLAAGCGRNDGPAREPISGKITFEGAPLKQGIIQFMPDPSDSGAIAGGGLIVDGAFHVDRAAGPTPGKYLVMVFSGENATKTADPSPDGAPGAPQVSETNNLTGVIPPKYNMSSTLVREVKQGGKNFFSFELTK